MPQDVLDAKIGLHVLKNSLLTHFLQYSPIKIHREIYRESLVKRGGFYDLYLIGAIRIPPEVTDKILAGQTLAFLIDDGMAPYKHKFTMLKEEVLSGPAGYYFRLHLPLFREIQKGLLHFRDAGIIGKVCRRLHSMAFWSNYDLVFCKSDH